MIESAIILGLGMSTVNFLVEAMEDREWEQAFEKSFFQAIAIGGVVYLHYLL